MFLLGPASGLQVKSDSEKCFYMIQFFLPVQHAGAFPVLHASKACEYILLCLVTTFFWLLSADCWFF